MVIVLDGFKIKSSEGINSFDLYEIKSVKSGPRMGLTDDVSFAYGASFPRCVQMVIQERIKADTSEGTLEEFMLEYNRISESTLEELKKVLKTLK